MRRLEDSGTCIRSFTWIHTIEQYKFGFVDTVILNESNEFQRNLPVYLYIYLSMHRSSQLSCSRFDMLFSKKSFCISENREGKNCLNHKCHGINRAQPCNGESDKAIEGERYREWEREKREHEKKLANNNENHHNYVTFFVAYVLTMKSLYLDETESSRTVQYSIPAAAIHTIHSHSINRCLLWKMTQVSFATDQLQFCLVIKLYMHKQRQPRKHTLSVS